MDETKENKHSERAEAMSGPLMWELVKNIDGARFFLSSISRTLRLHEIITAHNLWTNLTTKEKATYLANCPTRGFEPPGPILHLSKGRQTKSRVEDSSQKKAAVKGVMSARMCACGMMRYEKGHPHTGVPENPWRTRIHDRVGDSLAKQLRRMGATADLERVALQWTKKYQDKDGNDKYRVARIDVVATIPGSDELQWLDVTTRRPTAAANVEGGAKNGGFAALQGEKEQTRKYGNRNEESPDTVKPVRFDLGARNGNTDDCRAPGNDDKAGRSERRREKRVDGSPETTPDPGAVR